MVHAGVERHDVVTPGTRADDLRPPGHRSRRRSWTCRTGRNEYGAGSSRFAELMRDAAFWKLASAEHLTHHEPRTATAAQVARYSLVRAGRRVAGFSPGSTPAWWPDFRRPPSCRMCRSSSRGCGCTASPEPHRCPPPRPTGLLHPRHNRSITVREAARLQSFPDAYRLVGGRMSTFEQVVTQCRRSWRGGGR